MASNDLFAPPTQEEIGDPMFAPPSKEERYVSEPPPQEPDMSGIAEFFKKNLESLPAGGDILKGLEAGWQMSVSGLYARGQKPDVVLDSKKESSAANIASMIGQVAGDLPAIIPATIAGLGAGAAAGGAAGSAVPVLGTVAGAAAGGVVGAGAAGNAAPEALRQYLMEKYERGEFKDFGDFWDRSSAIFWETFKAGAAGAAGGAAGSVGGKIAGKVAGDALGGFIPRVADRAADIVTMTTVGAGLEGEVPSLQDFTNAGLMVAVIGGTTAAVGGTKHVSQKMRKIYAETGIKPEQIVEDAKADPIVQQELLMDNQDTPSAYKPLEETGQAVKPTQETTMSEVVNEPATDLNKQHPAVREFLDRIQETDTTGGQGKISTAVSDIIEKSKNARVRYQDQFIELKNLKEKVVGGEKLPADKDFYQLKRVENDYIAKAIHTIEKGTIDYKTGEINGKGMREIEMSVPSTELLDVVLIAKHSQDYVKRGLKSGFSPETAKEVLAMGEKGYSKAADEIVAFGKRNLKYYADSGMISQKSYKNMDRANEFYVPFQHVLDEKPSLIKSKKGNTNFLKRTRGTESDDFMIKSPLAAIKENEVAMKRGAERNRSNLAFLEFAKKNDVAIEKVSDPAHALDVSADEVSRHMESRGIEGDADGFKVWRKLPKPLAEGEIEVFEDGKRNVYRVDPKYAEPLNAFGGDFASTGLAMTLAQNITKIKKTGIVSTPAFKLRNFVNDQLTVAVTGKGNTLPFVDAMMAVGDIWKKNDNYWRWMRSGGVQGSYLKLDDLYVRRNLMDVHAKAGVLDRAWNFIKEPGKIPGATHDFLATTGQLLENATRVAEFKNVSKGATSGPKLFEGGFAARQGSVDFELRGASARLSAWNSISSFMNPNIQGVARFVEAFKENPAKVGAKGLMYITTPTLLLYWANRDNERIKRLPQWRKDLAWNIPLDHWVEASAEDHADQLPEDLTRVENDKLLVNRGWVVSVPRAFLPGLIFGAAIERSLDAYFEHDPDAFNHFDEAIQKEFVPNFIPDIALPFFEAKANKSFFSGKPLIPMSLERVAPELRYTNYTSETAKQIAKLTNSVTAGVIKPIPIVVDNYIRSWSGPVGQLAIQILDLGAEKAGLADFEKPESSWYENPLIGSFIARRADMNAASISKFYDHANEIEMRANSIKLKAKRNIFGDEYQEAIESLHVQSIKPMVKAGKDALAVHRKVIDEISKNKEMSKYERRQLVDNHIFMMISESDRMLEHIQEFEKQLGDIEKNYSGHQQE